MRLTMNRRQALRIFTSVSAGGSAVAVLASLESHAVELPLPDILRRARVLAESIVGQFGNRGFAEGTALQRSACETADLCRTALTRLDGGRGSSPAFWQSCADSAARSVETLESCRRSRAIPVSPDDVAEFTQLALVLDSEARRRAFAV